MKIYDCFTFFNELDLTELRLRTLWDHIDYFVIAESNLSHSGKSKEYIFENNLERFKPFMSKIRHIKIDDMPETTDSWVREKFQRKCLERGLTDRSPEDIVIVSDCDEIIRPELLEMIKQDENDYDRYVLKIPLFQYKINYLMVKPEPAHPKISVTRSRVFTNPDQERTYTFGWIPKPANTVVLEHGGWHFSYFGDNSNAITKIQNFAHTETDNPDMIARHDIDYFIKNKCGHHGPTNPERFEYVQVDDYFPETITLFLEKWDHMIIPNATATVEDIYQ
jgi:Glycosyltransferase family 17